MGLTRVIYLIHNPKFYSGDRVRKELAEEGYKDTFYISSGTSEFTVNYLKVADEVWCFGDCTELDDYKRAVQLGCDLWQMG